MSIYRRRYDSLKHIITSDSPKRIRLLLNDSRIADDVIIRPPSQYTRVCVYVCVNGNVYD